MSECPIDKPLLELETMIGFGGDVQSGLHVHPDRQHLIYPVGCTVVVEDIGCKKQEFLVGHTNSVSCIAISKSGKWIASGQITHMGFKADVIVWDYESMTMHCKLTLHRNKVEGLAFSPNDKYLVTLGGQDDGSVVLWDILKKDSICGAQAQVMSAGSTHTVACSNDMASFEDKKIFVTGGSGTLRVWQCDTENRKIWPTEVKMGQLKRVIKCVVVSEDDSGFYCGTTTGDILAINMTSSNFNLQEYGPREKERFSLGVTALGLLQKSPEIIVGAGDGTVALVKGWQSKFKKLNKFQKVEGAVTSIALRGQGHQFFVGTNKCNIYRFNLAEFTMELITTCHYDVINGLTFPYGYSGLVATCSKDDVRLWNMNKGQELLRIGVKNMTCNAVAIMKDGKSIITGWDDGKVRAYFPESGKPLYTMENAYGGSVTALATYSDCCKVVSGSNLGHVVVWTVPAANASSSQCKGKGTMYVHEHVLLKEHTAAVTCIKICANDTECVTSSNDGSCIIWDLVNKRRKTMIRVNTLFKYSCYNHEENQIITTGTDRKVAYWETYDGSMIRELDGSMSGSVNCMDISSDGQFFVSGGDDKLIKVWKYQEGEATHIGIGHSAHVTGIKISPDEKRVVSVSEDGAILIWKFPLTQLL